MLNRRENRVCYRFVGWCQVMRVKWCTFLVWSFPARDRIWWWSASYVLYCWMLNGFWVVLWRHIADCVAIKYLILPKELISIFRPQATHAKSHTTQAITIPHTTWRVVRAVLRTYYYWDRKLYPFFLLKVEGNARLTIAIAIAFAIFNYWRQKDKHFRSTPTHGALAIYREI